MPAPSLTIALEQFTTFGDLLKYLRRRSGLTQRELSIAVGYSVPQISRLEQNLRLPDLATVTARFLPALQAEDEPAVAARLLALAAAMRREDAPAPGLPPFKGLLYFDEADAELFFGREALVAKLAARLAETPAPPLRFLGVVGASGSGKSSLVRAGLIPALRWRPQSAAWPMVVLTPTAHPLEALAAALVSDGKASAASVKLAEQLGRDPAALLDILNIGAVASQPFLLVVDQFEELFTLCRDEAEQAAFVDGLLAAAGAAEGAGWVIIALRADFYAQCAGFAGLREALAHQQEFIGPMMAEELRRAIEEPARRGHWELEPGLVEVLLKDVGADGAQPPEPGALPLLSHALLETWQRRRGQTLTLSGYAAAGGVRGAIAETAEAVFHDQLDPAQRAIARQIFLRLTELGEAGVTADTRRRAALAELIPNSAQTEAVSEVLQMLADARLITTEQDAAEVAHEALIREWPTLRGWLEADREGLRLHRGLTEAAQEWARLGREPEALYRGVKLAQTLEWAGASENAASLNALEAEFLSESKVAAERAAAEREAAHQRELEAARKLAAAETAHAQAETARAEAAQKLGATEKQRADEQTRAASQLRRRALYLLGALVIAMVLAAAALYFGDQAREIATAAQSAGQLATARELAADAVNNLDIDAERSVLLALQAVSLADAPETEGALHQAMLADRLQLTLAGHQDQLISVTYSPDGKRLATSSRDATVIIWEAATGHKLLSLVGHTGAINDVAFSHDGTRLATASDDNTVKVWDAATGQVISTLTGPTKPVSRVAFSSDDQRVAATADDGTVKVWNLSTGQPQFIFFTPNLTDSPYVGLAISPDGTRLAAAEQAGDVIQLWDMASGKPVLTIRSSGEHRNLAFSPDGTRLAVTSGYVTKVWDVRSGAELLTLAGHTDTVRGVAFSPDGTRLVTGGLDRKAIIWDAVSGRQLFMLAGHLNVINRVAFSPDGQHVATASWDNTAKIWDVSPSHEAFSISAQNVIPSSDARTYLRSRMALSPDGKRVVVALPDFSAHVYDTSDGHELLVLRGHSDWIEDVVYSHDGTRIAALSFDNTVIVWDAVNGGKLLTVPGSFGGIAFSLDSKQLAVGGWQSITVYDVATGRDVIDMTDFNYLFQDVVFSPDGTRLASAATPIAPGPPQGVVIIWDLASGKRLATLAGHAHYVLSVAYNAQGTRLASGSADGTAKIWDAATGRELLTLTGHTGDVQRVSFSPDGTRLVTASLDGTARLWGATTGQELLKLYGDNTAMDDATLSPDGTQLFTATDQAVRAYVLPLQDLVALARSRVTRSLTAAECQQYLHVAVCPSSN